MDCLAGLRACNRLRRGLECIVRIEALRGLMHRGLKTLETEGIADIRHMNALVLGERTIRLDDHPHEAEKDDGLFMIQFAQIHRLLP